jgi:enamine deaminase RidA (YjgF/YER057c/UK114 family)
VVAPDGRTVYIAGQVAVDSAGRLVGGTDFRAQAEQVFANLQQALESVGAGFGDVAKTTIFVTDMSQLPALREVRAKYLDPDRPPASTLVQVAGLARPELLLEVEAVAVLRQPFGR